MIDTKNDPPRLIPSLVEGFNAVANNVYLLIFPVVMDLLFWFGPRLRVKQFFMPMMLEAAELSAAAYGDQAADFVATTQEIWTSIFDRFNLLFSMRTFPIGIPSLLIGSAVEINPVGNPLVFEITTGNAILGWLAVFLLAGLLLGSVYYALTAQAVIGTRPLKFGALANQSAQALILSVMLLAVVTLLSLPISCLLSSLILIMPSLGTLPFIILGLLMVWVLLPLVFSPHGIYAGDLKATRSIVTSFRLVRSIMAGTGMFFIILIIIGYGLDILWTTPTADSWLLAIGIFGHAFISSGLLAASFKFYDRGIKWQREILQIQQENKTSAA